MEAGNVLTLDEGRILEEAQKRGEVIANKSELWERIKPKWPIL